jgi:methyl-accepting chemotaxis protein
VNRIASHLNGVAKLDADKLADHTSCRLGRWYYGQGKATCGDVHSFKAMEDPHKHIHAIGKEIVQAHDSGDKEQARRLFEDLEDVSMEIIGYLDSLSGECKALEDRS